ncbi:MAG: HAD family hydrolase [Desulfobacterales bacterium]
MQYQAIFFDFDGVILDSVHVKTEAFAAMFRPYGPDIEKAVVDYHLANGGVSRFKKFEYYYTQLLNKPIDQETLDALGHEFNRLVLGKVLESSFIPGAMETLEKLKKNAVPAFVASGTPDEEIKLIVEKKGLSSYFLEVHGSPRKKDQIISDIAGRYNFDLPGCLFIGDAMTDYEAAFKCGTKFLGITKQKDQSPFPEGTRVMQHLDLQ